MMSVAMHSEDCFVECSCPQTHSSPSSLRAFFEAVRDRVRLIYHPLGFIDMLPSGVDLRTSRNARRRIALHAWSRHYSTYENPPSVCHSHGWPMESFLICGDIDNAIYRVAETQEDGPTSEYSVEYLPGDRVRMARTGFVSAIVESVEPLAAGHWYTMSPTDFHDARCTSEFALTAMLAGRRVSPSTVVYERSEAAIDSTPRHVLDAVTTKDMLSGISETLEGRALAY